MIQYGRLPLRSTPRKAPRTTLSRRKSPPLNTIPLLPLLLIVLRLLVQHLESLPSKSKRTLSFQTSIPSKQNAIQSSTLADIPSLADTLIRTMKVTMRKRKHCRRGLSLPHSLTRCIDNNTSILTMYLDRFLPSRWEVSLETFSSFDCEC